MLVELSKQTGTNGLNALVVQCGNAKDIMYIGSKEPYTLSDSVKRAFSSRVRTFCLYNHCEVTDAQFDALFEKPKPIEEPKRKVKNAKRKRKSKSK